MHHFRCCLTYTSLKRALPLPSTCASCSTSSSSGSTSRSVSVACPDRLPCHTTRSCITSPLTDTSCPSCLPAGHRTTVNVSIHHQPGLAGMQLTACVQCQLHQHFRRACIPEVHTQAHMLCTHANYKAQLFKPTVQHRTMSRETAPSASTVALTGAHVPPALWYSAQPIDWEGLSGGQPAQLAYLLHHQHVATEGYLQAYHEACCLAQPARYPKQLTEAIHGVAAPLILHPCAAEGLHSLQLNSRLTMVLHVRKLQCTERRRRSTTTGDFNTAA
eukprot:GHRQ01012597.1.p1 GENE.GHRQ01012597.1~~GHRQ01012597.1.p1  ORF type:complete len:274 (-),score=33.22 GHRQ01012597.1:140-961(-)